MHRLLMIVCLLSGIGCTNQTNKSNETETATTVNDTKSEKKRSEDNITGCYMEVIGRDTFAASLQQEGELVKGRFSFDNYEKDASTGPVSGRLQGNILRLLYR